MSTFKPDIFKNLRTKGYGVENTATSFEHPLVSVVPEINREELVEQLKKYGNALSGDEKLMYDYAKLSISVAHNIFDTRHTMHVFSGFLLQSLKKLYPTIDLSKLELAMLEVDRILYETSKEQEPKDNELMIPVMIGMLEKMI